MELWSAYDFIVNTVHAFMLKTDECLVNALTITLAGPERTKLAGIEHLSDEKLLKIRGSFLELAKFVEQELEERAADRAEADDDGGCEHGYAAGCCRACDPDGLGAR